MRWPFPDGLAKVEPCCGSSYRGFAIWLAGHPFERRRFERAAMVLTVRWYLGDSNLVEVMAERGPFHAQTAIMCPVLLLRPTIEQRLRKHARPVGRPWQVDAPEPL